MALWAYTLCFQARLACTPQTSNSGFELSLMFQPCFWQAGSPAGASMQQTLLNKAEGRVFDACSVPGKPAIGLHRGRKLENLPENCPEY